MGADFPMLLRYNIDSLCPKYRYLRRTVVRPLKDLIEFPRFFSYSLDGNAILALASNGTHHLWKWSRNETNLSGKATTKDPPQLWQPKSGLLMTNDLTGGTFEELKPCFYLSKNDSYVVSASSGVISLFNMITFKGLITVGDRSVMAAAIAAVAAQQPVSAPVVGNAFVQQYYHIQHQPPRLVHRFYQDISKLGRPDGDGGYDHHDYDAGSTR